jgi:hypothetical protein
MPCTLQVLQFSIDAVKAEAFNPKTLFLFGYAPQPPQASSLARHPAGLYSALHLALPRPLQKRKQHICVERYLLCQGLGLAHSGCCGAAASQCSFLRALGGYWCGGCQPFSGHKGLLLHRLLLLLHPPWLLSPNRKSRPAADCEPELQPSSVRALPGLAQVVHDWQGATVPGGGARAAAQGVRVSHQAQGGWVGRADGRAGGRAGGCGYGA